MCSQHYISERKPCPTTPNLTQPKGGAFDAMAAQFHPVKPGVPPPDRIRTKKSPRPHNAG